MDWSIYKDRMNSLLVRSEPHGVDAAILAGIIVVFGLTDEEHFNLDLHGMDDEMEKAFNRVVAEMEAAGIEVGD